ncbi:hypothetical protein [Chryseobacterium sp. 6424]|uniref:hypothetical protein n=1 Tax=Chryseobacterium sp. 6424 TaxID=2039166 RepID=UPI0013CF017C|nr:hypothetical protein [Chryseobacterium sp. 6424]
MADYQLNRAYYETVCENKNRPAMQCHGKCQANKQSQNTSESYNFSSLIFTFINTVMHDIPLQDTTELATVNVTSEISVKIWSQIFIGVPNPPPNI